MLLIFVISFGNVWFDGLYVNAEVSLSTTNKSFYIAGEDSLILADKELQSFLLSNIFNKNNIQHINGIFLYKSIVSNTSYTIWLRKRLILEHKNILPIKTGLVVVIKGYNKIKIKPKILFANGKILKSFTTIPPFFDNVINAIKSQIVGNNPIVVAAKCVKNGDIILYNKDVNNIENVRKVFDFIKFNRILFIINDDKEGEGCVQTENQ